MSHGEGHRCKNSKDTDIKIAKELHYPKTVILKLMREPDLFKRTRILRDARHGLYD